MAFGTQDNTDEVMNEINMTPLVDVMLVLLIIFIITVPVMKNSVSVDLPRASVQAEQIKPETLRLSVQADGSYNLDGAAISDEALELRLKAASLQTPQPELHLSGDRNVRYERVAQALATAQRAGVRKIGFVTEPKQ